MDNIVLQEMYFGKLPGLLKIEDLFTKLQQKYKKGDAVKNLSLYRDMIKDPILNKIGNALCELFGFKEVAITIARDDSFNAYCVRYVTDGQGNIYNIDEQKIPFKIAQGSVIVNNNGFMFDKKKLPVNIVICINLGCLFHTKLTLQELMSVLLHEIGHTFSLIMMTNKMTSKADETFADGFAASYGYGEHLTSAFSKIAIRYSNFDKMLKDVPVLNIITGINQIFWGWLYHDPFEDHPTTKVRLDKILRQMEIDLKETPNLPVGMRKDLQRQINRTKEIISRTYDANDDDTTGVRMTKFYYREMEPGMEIVQNNEADKYAHPTKINNTIRGMRKSMR